MTVWFPRTDPLTARHVLGLPDGEFGVLICTETNALPPGFCRPAGAWPSLVLGRPVAATFVATWGPYREYADVCVFLLGHATEIHR